MGGRKKDALLKLRVNQGLKDALDAIAVEKQEALSVIVREALQEFLAKHQRAEAPPDPEK